MNKSLAFVLAGFVVLGCCLVDAAGAEKDGTEILVLPFPQKMTVSPARIALDGPVCIVTSATGEVVDYAAGRLANDLAERVGLAVKTGEANRVGSKLIIELKIAPSRPEGYVITTGTREGTPLWSLAGNDPNGILYGTFTVRQLIENASAAAGRPVAPKELSVEDWPTMATRLLPSEIYDISDDDPKRAEKIGRLEWSSFWRFNAFWRAASAPEANIAYIARLGRRRGMTLVGVHGFMGMVKNRGVDDGICPSRGETLAHVRKIFEKCARAGCGGFVFNFDDLTREVRNHYSRCPRCKKRFKSLAEWELVFIKQMVDVGRKHGIRKLIICSTPYQKKGYTNPEFKDYFKVLCGADFMKDVLVFHCDFYTDEIRKLKALGLRNYIWWNNGLWPSTSYFDGIYMGIPKVHYIWYGAKRTTEDPVAPIPEAMESLKNLGSVCRHVYPSPTGSYAGRAIGGCLGWNPRATVERQPVLRKALVEMLYGRGAWKPYSTWEENMLAWFTDYRVHSISVDVAEQRKRIDAALAAWEEIKKRRKTARGVDAPWRLLAGRAELRLNQMRKTITEAIDSLKAASLAPPVKAAEKKAASDDVLLWLRMVRAEDGKLRDDSSRALTATFKGKGPFFRRGVLDNALFFNGVDNQLRIAPKAAASLNPGKDSFSVECWTFMMGHAWNQFVGKRGSTRDCYRGAGWGLGSDRHGSTLRFTIEDGERKWVSVHVGYGKLLYHWRHVAVVRDRSTKEILFYVDGELKKKVADPTGDVTNDLPVLCGLDGTAGGRYWGFLDEVRCWKRALSAREVRAHYEAGLQALSEAK